MGACNTDQSLGQTSSDLARGLAHSCVTVWVTGVSQGEYFVKYSRETQPSVTLTGWGQLIMILGFEEGGTMSLLLILKCSYSPQVSWTVGL